MGKARRGGYKRSIGYFPLGRLDPFRPLTTVQGVRPPAMGECGFDPIPHRRARSLLW